MVPALPCRAKTGTSCCSVVNQTQVEEKETSDEETRKRNNIVGVMNERGMELMHVLKDTETVGPVRDVGPFWEQTKKLVLIISQK